MTAKLIFWVIAIYAVVGTALAFSARKGMGGGVEEYFLASRSFGPLVAIGTYTATIYGAFMTIGLPALVYRSGIGAEGLEILYLAGLLLVVYFGPRFWLAGKKYGYITPYEMFADRFNSKWVAIVMGIGAIIFLVPYCASQVMGIGYTLQGLTNGVVPFIVGVTIAIVLSVLWAVIAGLRSVAWTDTLMATIMLIGVSAVTIYVVNVHLGGFGSLFHALETNYPQHLTVPGPDGYFSLGNFLGITVGWFLFSMSYPHITQRLFVSDSIKTLRSMIRGFMCFGLFYTFICITWGLCARVLMPGLENPDLATPMLLGNFVPPVLSVIVMVGIVAAVISTVDSVFLSLSSLLSEDVCKNASPEMSENKRLKIGKYFLLIQAVIVWIFSVQQFDMVAILQLVSSAFMTVMVPTIVGCFFWKKSTAAGSLSSVIGGGALALYLTLANVNPLGLGTGVWALVVASVIYVVVSLATQPPTEKAEEFLGYLDDALAEKNCI